MKKIIAIVGPTAVGKTNLAIKIAKYLNTDVISGDSVQVYRHLDIGSGKIKESEKEGVVHHLIDIINPNEDYTVSDFQKDARLLIDEMTEKGKIPLFSGGTGLYLKAAFYDYDFSSVKRDNRFLEWTNEELQSKLKSLNDPELPDINNRKRLERHLELLTSTPLTKPGKDIPLYDVLLIGLTMNREHLYQKIDERVDQMMRDGLVLEAKDLYDQGIKSKSVTSIGYRELYSYLNHEISLDTAVSLIKQHTRNFAKRQYTWFKNQMHPKWIDVEVEDPYLKAKELIDIFLKE